MTNNKKTTVKKILIYISIAILALAITGLIYATYLFSSIKTEIISTNDKDLGITETTPKQTKDIKNFVLYGIDSTDGKKGRSDAIMVVTVDTINTKIKLSSIPRDSYVNIPGYGMDKINHAYAFGGPELAIKTLNTNFNLDVRYFATVNFDSLPKIIDSLGGVSITITDSESTQISGISKGGTYLLNGNQALAFTRIRKLDSDFERGRRQRDVVQAMITKMLGASALSYPNIISKIMPEITTNMTTGQILETAYSIVSNKISNIEQTRFPAEDLGRGQMIKGVYYYVFDIEENKKRVQDYIYNDLRTP